MSHQAHDMRLIVLASFIATPALAKPGDGVKEEDLAPKSEILPSVEGGEVLPWSLAARHIREGILISTFGGYDAAKETPMMFGSAELTVLKRLTVRATATNPGLSEQLKPSFGLLYDVVRDDYVDVAVGGDYELMSWNNYPAFVPHVAAATNAGAMRVQANAGLGIGANGAERYGDFRLSGLHPVASSLVAGVDSRARIDLERNADEPSGELDWDMQAGPIATLALGRFALSATGGVSAWKLRSRDNARLGAIGALGLAAAF